MTTRRQALVALGALAIPAGLPARNADAAACEPLPSGLNLSTCQCSPTPMALAERELIIRQALLLVEDVYVHLPLKRERHKADPVKDLKRLLASALDPKVDDERFDRELISVMSSVRDRHLTFYRPGCFKGCHAFLPFIVAEITENKAFKYLVSGWRGPGAAPSGFGVGTEIVSWNGVPIERAILEHADREPGAHPDARRAMAIDTLTLRFLRYEAGPQEECVVVGYRASDDSLATGKFMWRVTKAGPVQKPPVKPSLLTKPDADLDRRLQEVLRTRSLYFAASPLKKSASSLCKRETTDDFSFHRVDKDGRALGYIRIWDFGERENEFVNGFRNLLMKHVVKQVGGLIIDVRDNPGGKIRAAERVLQMLTSRRPIQPALFQFRNSKLTETICRGRDAGEELSRFADLIKAGRERGELYSAPLPMTSCQECNSMAPLYTGPLVLLTSAMSYSAADFFAAAFDDHDMGWILGVHPTTGGGGANSRSLDQLREILQAKPPFEPLARDADIKIALRRSLRVGRNANKLLEEDGVRAHKVHDVTRNDIKNCYADLLEEARKWLEKPFEPQSPVRPSACIDVVK